MLKIRTWKKYDDDERLILHPFPKIFSNLEISCGWKKRRKKEEKRIRNQLNISISLCVCIQSFILKHHKICNKLYFFMLNEAIMRKTRFPVWNNFSSFFCLNQIKIFSRLWMSMSNHLPQVSKPMMYGTSSILQWWKNSRLWRRS